MAKNIEISLVSNTRDFVKGTQNAADALEDVAGSLDDLARDAQRDGRRVEEALEGIGDEGKRQGDRAGDGLADGIQDGTRGSESEIERLNRSFRELATEARKEGKRAGDGLGDGVGRGVKQASEGVQDFKGEAKQNAEEVASSFDGSIESIGDGFQGLAASALSGFGPAGVVAGVALAAGIGLGMAGFEDAQEATERLKTRISELTAEYITAGTAITSTEFKIAALEALATTTEEGEKSLVDLKKSADTAGLSWKDYVGALTGTKAQQQALWREVDATVDATDAQLRATRLATGSFSEETRALEKKYGAQVSMRDEIGKSIGVTTDATLRQELYADATEDAAAQLDAQAKAEEAATARVEAAAAARADAAAALQTEIDEAVTGFDDYIDAETGAVDPQRYIDGMRQRREATENFSDNVDDLADRFQLSQEEQQKILDLGLDFAPLLQGIRDSGMEEQFVGEIRAGMEAGQRLVDETVFEKYLRLKVDDSALVTWKRNQGPISLDIRVPQVRFDQLYGKRVLQ